MTVFTILHFVKRFVWDNLVLIKFSYYHDFFYLYLAMHLSDFHCHRWVRYIYTTKITVLRFVWYCLVFTQYSYYCDLFCSGQTLILRYFHSHGWVRYIDTTKITVACMSSLLFSIDIQQYFYFITFYLKLTNDAMVK